MTPTQVFSSKICEIFKTPLLRKKKIFLEKNISENHFFFFIFAFLQKVFNVSSEHSLNVACIVNVKKNSDY